jgi:hypothetical protein
MVGLPPVAISSAVGPASGQVAGAAGVVVVLTCWAIAGALIVIAPVRQRRAAPPRSTPHRAQTSTSAGFVAAAFPSTPALATSIRPRWVDNGRLPSFAAPGRRA